MESSITIPWCPSLEVFFNFTPEHPSTFSDPGCPAEAEFVRFEYNGEPIATDLEEILFDTQWGQIEDVILAGAPKIRRAS